MDSNFEIHIDPLTLTLPQNDESEARILIEHYFNDNEEALDLNYFINYLCTFKKDTLMYLLKPYFNHKYIVYLNEYLNLNLSEDQLYSLLSIEVQFWFRINWARWKIQTMIFYISRLKEQVILNLKASLMRKWNSPFATFAFYVLIMMGFSSDG